MLCLLVVANITLKLYCLKLDNLLNYNKTLDFENKLNGSHTEFFETKIHYFNVLSKILYFLVFYYLKFPVLLYYKTKDPTLRLEN